MWTILESSADKTAHLPEFDEPLLLGDELSAPVRWRRLLAYIIGCMVLLVFLLAQMLYFYQDYFFRHAFWRPLLVQICQPLNCELPAEKNAAALRSVFLTVETHPDYQSMLLVKFRIQNTAMYPQSYPSVELLFSNTEDKPVAARRFYPGHYLALPLLSKGAIAAGAEVDGALEIANPGADAVNYTLEFVYENN